MANINLKRFVDIDIKQHERGVVKGTREIVVLFSPEGTAGTVKEIKSLADATYTATGDTYKYLKVFFDNGGKQVNVHEGFTAAPSKDVIKALPNEQICVAFVHSDPYTALKPVITALNSDIDIYGINEKILFARENKASVPTDSIKNFVVKHSSVTGAEMAAAAYFTRINVYRDNTVFDYAFTAEDIAPEDISDTVFETIIDNNENVDITLAGATRNCGGNCKNGADATNTYVTILLHQTLTERLVDLLSQKIKGAAGVGKIYSVIAQELERYLYCGFLSTGKVWEDDDLVITHGGVEYEIIAKGDSLINGYVIKVLPVESLSPAERAERKSPAIYVVIADQYGIRKITINGEII